MVRELGPAYAVAGHSLGGGCSASAILEGLETRRAVFIAPAVDPEAFTKRTAAMLGYGERIRTRMVGIAMRRTGYAPSDFVLPARLAARGDLPDALVLHDAEDPVVGVDDGRTMAASWRGARLVVTSGLGHNRILRHDASIAAVADFIAGGEARPARDIAGFAQRNG